MGDALKNANIKIKTFEDDALKFKNLEEKLKFME